MPANEQTWRDQKAMHVIFGLSGLGMLVATIWMFAEDHIREWKVYQKVFYDRVEPVTTEYRLEQQLSGDFLKRRRDDEQALAQARATVPPKAQVDAFLEKARTREMDPQYGYDLPAIETAYRTLANSPDARALASDDAGDARDQAMSVVAALRDRLVESMQAVADRARFIETKVLLQRRKFRRADFDVARSNYELSISQGASAERQAELQAVVNKIKDDVEAIDAEYQAANTHRKQLETDLAAITERVRLAQKAADDNLAEYNRLRTTEDEQRPNVGKWLAGLPIIDAFNTGSVEIKQTWLPDLLINYKHARVARFDRCTTCHLGIDKTQPGSADVPGFAHEQSIATAMATPAEAPKATVASTLRQMDANQDGLISREEAKDDLRENFDQFDRVVDELVADGFIDRDELAAGYSERDYGLLLAERGMLNDDDVTVAGVRPESPAAKAGLLAGDVLARINDVEITDKQLAYHYLLDSVRWGEPLPLTVRRGLPHPYSTHPRLDLFVGSLSPHAINDFGCTICHDGQGSATSFKWSSHTPNTPFEEEKWKSERHWINNHFWEYPMKPSRFVESTCIMCHHEVTELEPSPKYREPPAPKVVRGFNLVREYGCFGCHEINGFDGPHRRIGPDLRAEPAYAAAAEQLLTVPGLNEQEQELAQRVIAHPEDGEARHRLAELIQADANAAEDTSAQPRFGATASKLAGIVGADTETPGKYRKVGPSLRHVASKVDFDFLYNWVQEPKDFRPTTKMPQFFRLDEHLVSAHHPAAGNSAAEHGPAASAENDGQAAEHGKGLGEALRFEPVEIHSIVSYLLAKSQPFEYLGRPEGVSEEPSAERGERLFQTRGCLACHQHEKFPQAREDQGPNLSRLGSKLRTPAGQSWLYSWVREPNRYHARTKMPNLFLEPIRETVKEGDATREIVTDPAADIAAFLLSSQGWEPKQPPRVDDKAVDELAIQYLTGSGTTKVQANQYLKEGIASSLASDLTGDEVELVVGDGEPLTIEHKLLYVGRRAIAKYGCSGCHDIPGFEDAKPIGTGLADWGRKDLSQLAFEQISHYIEETDAGADHNIYAAVKDMDPDKGYFIEQLMAHQREGFIWQKLRAPRSFDFKKTENKTYNERLRMPKFPFTPEDIEAVATFVLGLVAEPPAPRYVYQGDPRRKAIVEGRQVIDKYNCGGCHTLEMETWEFDYNPNEFADPPPFQDYAVLMPHFTPAQLADSKRTDYRGLGHAAVTGMPLRDDDGNLVNASGDEESPMYAFQLWQPVAINGQPWIVGGQDIPILKNQITTQWPPVGGSLARLIHPAVVAYEKLVNPNVKGSDVWGWLPPPLIREGDKVQTAWLHDFLLNPYPIRPAAVLRMPKFNMTSDEASKLVSYFAAVDGVEYPYEYNPRTQSAYLAQQAAEHENRLQDALRIVTNGNYCVKCHLVGDFTPEGSATALAPNLEEVYRRLRPEYLQQYLANPKSRLPYTGMPVNFPLDKPVPQEIYAGDSPQQLNAVVDLLLNYDKYMKRQTSIKPLVTPATPMPEGTPTTGN